MSYERNVIHITFLSLTHIVAPIFHCFRNVAATKLLSEVLLRTFSRLVLFWELFFLFSSRGIHLLTVHSEVLYVLN